jgi:HAMP domain-containing protein
LPKLAGRYEVLEHIGQGAMADVFRAYDPSINRPLAIKVLKGELRQHPQYAPRLLREAKAAGALSHPNIVTIYDVGELDGYPYIVMELLEGEPLDAVLQRGGSMPADQVLDIGVQLADALAYAHAQGVVHRDIKPSNIILGHDGRTAKLVDFGIARVAEGGDLEMADTLQTQVGQVLGTPRYMSPEQALGREIDGRSDLFSVGVILYELLSGKKAFAGASAATLALQITQQDPLPLNELAPEAPKGLQFIIEKLLCKRPEKRFSDGAQLAGALRRERATQQALHAETAAAKRRLPLQLRLTLLMAAMTATVLMFSVGAVLNRQYGAMQHMALTSGSAIASFVASNAALQAADNAALPPEQRDWLPVESFVKAASADPNVQQLTVVDAGGVIRAASDPAVVGRRYVGPAGESRVQVGADTVVTETDPKVGQAGFRFVRPITYAGRPFGMVDVVVSKNELNAAARASGWLLLGLSLVTLGAVIAVSYILARMLAAPIRRLTKALSQAAAGDLDFRLSHSRKDEFGELFDAFNGLSAAMQERLEPAQTRAHAGVRLAVETEPPSASDATCIVDPAEQSSDHTIIRQAG